jgi:hypothetical protein
MPQIVLATPDKAAKLPGQALALYLAVHHQTALTGKALATLPVPFSQNLALAEMPRLAVFVICSKLVSSKLSDQAVGRSG